MTNLIHIVPNFVDKSDAELWMKEADHPSATEQTPEYYKDRFGGTALPYNKNTRQLNKKYGRKAAEYVRELYGFKSPVYVYKVFMNHTTNVGYSGGVHTDSVDPEPWIEWSAVLYLDDKFTGANLHFPNQQYIHKPTPLEAVIFPSSGTSHMHGISEMKSGERYSIVICLTSQPWKADPDMLEPQDNMEYAASAWNMNEEEAKRGMA
jgi:hypothetical protein